MNSIIEQREAWAEIEARHFDRVAEELERSAAAWMKKLPHPENTHAATTCLLKAQAWRDAAGSLRQPKAIRLEREAQTHD